MTLEFLSKTGLSGEEEEHWVWGRYGAVVWAECPGRGKEAVTVLTADWEKRVEACNRAELAESLVTVAVGQAAAALT